MKAIRIHEYGDADVLRYEETDKPHVQDGDVLIRVAATSFNPIDAKMRAGLLREMVPKVLPFVIGWDCAGTVESVGAGVRNFQVGDRVFAMTDFARGGTYAQYVAVEARQVALAPKSLSLVAAAALPMVAQTALLAIDSMSLQPGQVVLIHGGAGGVGSLAIQIAKARGAQVITTASGSDLEFVKSLGADQAIDYKTTHFQNAVGKVDAVLDVLGGQTQEDSFDVLKSGGVLIATSQPPALDKAQRAGVRAEFIFTAPNGQALSSIAEMVDAGHLRPVINAEVRLENARQVHESKTGRGKTVIVVE